MSKQIISTYKRGDIWWYSFTTPNQKRVRKSAKTQSHREAKELAAREYNLFWRVEKLGERPLFTWEDAVVTWFNEKPQRKKSKDTLSKLRWIDPYLRGKYLVDITRELINQIKTTKQATGVSNETVNHTVKQVRTILRCAMNNDMLDKVPFTKRLPEKTRRIRWLTVEEEARLLNALPNHLKPVVKVALLTGLRKANVVNLKWEQIDLDKNYAWVNPDEAKMGKAIGVPLNKEAKELISSQLGKHETFVFTRKGQPLNDVYNGTWRAVSKRAGLEDFHFHDLRHTWATRHIMAGTPTYVLQELGGWSDSNMVRRYAHLSANFLQDYAERVSNIGTNLAQMLEKTTPPTPQRTDNKRFL